MSNKPKRIQRKRIKGWRMPENAVSVTRPGRWGNIFKVGVDGTAQECVDKYREAIERGDSRLKFTKKDIPELRGKDPACWCKPGDPCHADVLLELANRD